jgi:hypothetical protein
VICWEVGATGLVIPESIDLRLTDSKPSAAIFLISMICLDSETAIVGILFSPNSIARIIHTNLTLDTVTSGTGKESVEDAEGSSKDLRNRSEVAALWNNWLEELVSVRLISTTRRHKPVQWRRLYEPLCLLRYQGSRNLMPHAYGGCEEMC